MLTEIEYKNETVQADARPLYMGHALTLWLVREGEAVASTTVLVPDVSNSTIRSEAAKLRKENP